MFVLIQNNRHKKRNRDDYITPVCQPHNHLTSMSREVQVFDTKRNALNLAHILQI